MSPMAESILESLLAIGAISGTLLFRYFGDRFGLKTSLLINAVTLIVGWTLTILAPHGTSLVPQLICGLAAGGIFYLTPIFLQEITEDHIRETLIAYILLSCNCGIVTMFIMPDYCSFKVYFALFLAIPSAYFFVVLFYLPETTAPFGGFEDDEKELPLYNSNKNYRCYGCLLQRQSSEESSDGSCEYSANKTSAPKVNRTLRDYLKCRSVQRLFLIGTIIMWLNQTFGLFTIMTISGTIAKEAKSTLGPNTSSCVVGVIQLVGSYCGSMSTQSGIALGLSGLGVYGYCKGVRFLENDTAIWIVLICFCFPIFVGNYSMLAIPFLVVSEMFPRKVRIYTNIIIE